MVLGRKGFGAESERERGSDGEGLTSAARGGTKLRVKGQETRMGLAERGFGVASLGGISGRRDVLDSIWH